MRRARPETPRVVQYTRVSTDGQEASGAGLAAQEAAVQGFAAYRGWPVVARLTDTCSGGVAFAARLGGAAALDLIERGTADALVVSALDRLGRSVLDVYQTWERIEKAGAVLVVTSIGVDTSQPTGRAMMGMSAVFGALERDTIRQRTRDAMRAKKGTLRADGSPWRAGRPSKLDPAVRERILAEHRAGRGFEEIARGLRADEVPTAQGGVWTRSTVQYVVRH